MSAKSALGSRVLQLMSLAEDREGTRRMALSILSSA